MAFFAVVVHGECPPARTASGGQCRGFYSPRFVRASSAAQACEKALALVAADSKTAAVERAFGGSATLSIASCSAASWWPGLRRSPGYVVYDEEATQPDDARVV